MCSDEPNRKGAGKEWFYISKGVDSRQQTQTRHQAKTGTKKPMTFIKLYQEKPFSPNTEVSSVLLSAVI